jgi:hypothetical protein
MTTRYDSRVQYTRYRHAVLPMAVRVRAICPITFL